MFCLVNRRGAPGAAVHSSSCSGVQEDFCLRVKETNIIFFPYISDVVKLTAVKSRQLPRIPEWEPVQLFTDHEVILVDGRIQIKVKKIFFSRASFSASVGSHAVL